MTGPTYELVMNIFTIINVFSVFLRSFMQNASASAINGWMIAQMVINGILLFEMIADFIIAGPIKAYQYHFRVWPETMCQIINVIATTIYIENVG